MTVVDEIKQEAELTEELTRMMHRHAVMYETVLETREEIIKEAKAYIENGTEEEEFLQTVEDLYESATDAVMYKFERKISEIKEFLNR